MDGIDALMNDIQAVAELPGEVTDEILLAEAAVVERAQRKKAREYGVHRSGVTLESIGPTEPKSSGIGGASIYVYPQGVNADGNRNAEVAFVNEYGKRGQPPRPFIKAANEECADEAVEAATRVYDNFLKSKNL